MDKEPKGLPWHVTALVGVVAFFAAFLLADVIDYPNYMDVDGRSLVLVLQTVVAATGAGLGLYAATRYRDSKQKEAEERERRHDLVGGLLSLSAEFESNNKDLNRLVGVFSKAIDSEMPKFPGDVARPILGRTVLDGMAGRIGLFGQIAPRVLRHYEILRTLEYALLRDIKVAPTQTPATKRMETTRDGIRNIMRDGESILTQLKDQAAESRKK